MQSEYIKTKEIIEKFGVSYVTVAKWLLDTSKEQTGLKYEKVGKRIKLLNLSKNWLILEDLSKKASSKRQKIFSSQTVVSQDLYQYFSHDELIEIVRDLEFKRNINYKFTYKGEGADYWDQFYQENVENGSYKTPKRTEEILNYYTPLIIDKMKNYDQVNIVEIGPGNALPVINFIKKIKEFIPLKRYIGVDISNELLNQAIENISQEIPDLDYEKFTKDIERDRIDSVFSYSYTGAVSVANIVIIVGGTILNTYETKAILQNIRRALSPNDILIFSTNADTPGENLNFTYNYSPESMVQDTWIPRLMGINVDKCELISEYDEKNNRKVEYLVLDKDYSVEFADRYFNRKVILRKKEKLYLWVYFVTDIDNCINIFKNAGYSLLDGISLPDNKHFMLAVQAKITNI